MPGALLIGGLIVLAYVPFGILGAAAVLAFRTTGPLPAVVLTGSAFLGGVYYPTEVIPSWLEQLSAVIPLTYGLRALRRTFLEGLPLGSVSGDLAILVGFIVVLMGASVLLFGKALKYARRTGSLALY
jgi:ABC-2 type transport system permease protein